jgi:hypothetical protein
MSCMYCHILSWPALYSAPPPSGASYLYRKLCLELRWAVQVLERGEKLDLLVGKTDALSDVASAFRRDARRLRTTMWWRVGDVVAGG